MDKQKSKYQSGTAHSNRMPKMLLPSSTLIDERSTADLLALLARYAKEVRFVDIEGQKDSDWSHFFEKDISVFLAQIMSFRLDKIEQELQQINYELGQYGAADITKTYSLLKALLQLCFTLIFQINDWYLQSFNLRPIHGKESKIELILERAITAELGEKIRKLYGYLQSDPDLLAQYRLMESEWQALHPIWRLQQSPQNQLFQGDRFQTQIIYAAKEIRLILRTIILSTAYIINIAPSLFEESITHKQDHEPDMGLMLTFLQLFKKAQAHLNQFTERHLDFYFFEQLQLQAKKGTPSRAIVHFQLAQKVPTFHLEKHTALFAGINEKGIPSYYQTNRDLLLSTAKIVKLKSLFIAQNAMFGIKSSYQLISNIYTASVDVNQQFELQSGDQNIKNWALFGEDQLNIGERSRQMTSAKIGFMLTSSVLNLVEGERKIEIRFSFEADSVTNFINLINDVAKNENAAVNSIIQRLFKNALIIDLSGKDQWINIKDYAIELINDGDKYELLLGINLNIFDPSIVPYNSEILGESYQTNHPVIRFILNGETALFLYSFVKDLVLKNIDIDVAVQGLQSLTLYNEEGLIDNTGPFAPFGSIPSQNTYCLIGSSELFSKDLKDLKINIEWNKLPQMEGGFATYYKAYPHDIDNDSFQIGLSALSKRHFIPKEDLQQTYPLFQTQNDQLQKHTQLDEVALKKLDIQADYNLQELIPYSNQSPIGFLKLILKAPIMGFGHQEFPMLFAKMAMANSKQSFLNWGKSNTSIEMPNEPFMPIVKKLSVDYTAQTSIHFNEQHAYQNMTEKGDQFLHIDPFGVLKINAGRTAAPHLLPNFGHHAYLYIGIKDIQQDKVLSILFDIKESHKDIHQNTLETQWFYLAYDQWHPFSTEALISDATENFTQTGIIQIHIPNDIQKDNNLLDKDTYWLCIAAQGNLDIIGNLNKIVPHVVEATWIPNGDKPAFTETGLTPISDFKTSIAAIKKVQQVSPFYGNQAPESKTDFYLRTSERLRHKNRLVNLWDYEHMVLQKFPQISQVKAMGYTQYKEYIKAGDVLLAVIPKTSVPDLQAKAGFYQLQKIQRFLQKQSSHFANISVINPYYEPIIVKAAIVFKKNNTNDNGIYLQYFHEALKHFICPWLKGGIVPFNKTIKKNDLLTFIKNLPFVDFISGFSVTHVLLDHHHHTYAIQDTASQKAAIDSLIPSTPWSVLVPAKQHDISILELARNIPASETAIDNMRLGTDFIIVEGKTEESNHPIDDNSDQLEDFFQLP